MKDFSERCREEAAFNVIFLFQKRQWQVLGAPEGYKFTDDFDVVNEIDSNIFLSKKQLSVRTFDADGNDLPCAVEHWYSELVFLSREEANQYGEDYGHRYHDGWRVFGVSAVGELVNLLKGT